MPKRQRRLLLAASVVFLLVLGIVAFLRYGARPPQFKAASLPQETSPNERTGLIRNTATVPYALASGVQSSLLLVGDAGDLPSSMHSLMQAHVKLLPDATTLIYLGDNIYSRGLPDVNDPKYAQSHDRLLRQITGLNLQGTRIVFIPGNHDWDDSGPRGLEFLKNQEVEVTRILGPGSFAPLNGCPGPELIVHDSFKAVIAFDSHWFLHTAGPKPKDASSGCKAWTPDMFESNLRELAQSLPPNLPIFIVQHHPLKSSGHRPTNAPEYVAMKRAVEKALANRPALLCAAGHDHFLELLGGAPGCRYNLVSGAAARPSEVGKVSKDLIAGVGGKTFGFARVDLHSSGKIELSMLTLASDAPLGNLVFSRELDGP